jgi:hypothetical protein
MRRVHSRHPTIFTLLNLVFFSISFTKLTFACLCSSWLPLSPSSPPSPSFVVFQWSAHLFHSQKLDEQQRTTKEECDRLSSHTLSPLSLSLFCHLCSTYQRLHLHFHHFPVGRHERVNMRESNSTSAVSVSMELI